MEDEEVDDEVEDFEEEREDVYDDVPKIKTDGRQVQTDLDELEKEIKKEEGLEGPSKQDCNDLKNNLDLQRLSCSLFLYSGLVPSRVGRFGGGESPDTNSSVVKRHRKGDIPSVGTRGHKFEKSL